MKLPMSHLVNHKVDVWLDGLFKSYWPLEVGTRPLLERNVGFLTALRPLGLLSISWDFHAQFEKSALNFCTVA